MKELTSNNIPWEEGMLYAIVDRETNKIEVQTKSGTKLSLSKWSNIGAYGYSLNFHYQVSKNA